MQHNQLIHCHCYETTDSVARWIVVAFALLRTQNYAKANPKNAQARNLKVPKICELEAAAGLGALANRFGRMVHLTEVIGSNRRSCFDEDLID